METSDYFRGHGFMILLLVVCLSSVSCLDLEMNGFHNDRKRLLSSGTKGGGGGFSPQRKEVPLCGLNDPAKDGKLFLPFCEKGYVFSEITFADYGQPTGSSCKALKRGNCGASSTMSIVKKNCLGKERCRLYIGDEMFGPTHCKGPVTFAFSAICKKT